MDRLQRKNTGSYYTSDAVADYIAAWAMEAGRNILEPSFGDGAFVDALYRLGARVTGVELQQEPYDICKKKHPDLNGVVSDFMDYEPGRLFDGVVGNPPYVSVKKLSEEDRDKALKRTASHGVEMATSGSMWMPFVVHASEFLAPGGRLGFVLPYELAYVRYAFPLWTYLSRAFGRLRLLRIYRDIFPDVDVETVLLLCENRGGSTSEVEYEIYDDLEKLITSQPSNTARVRVDEILDMSKPFERKIIPTRVIELLDKMRQIGRIAPLVDSCKFNIGYVSGNKEFFQISSSDIKRYHISPDNLKPSLLNAKQLNPLKGIQTLGAEHDMLFYPSEIGDGERRYIKHGEKLGVDQAYKCRVRKPWYIVPGLVMPDVILTVFGDVPKLMINDGKMYASNSLLCGATKNPKETVCVWYNSLTLLSIETSVHSLGGGTLVMIPGETDKIETLAAFPSDRLDEVFEDLRNYALTHTPEQLYLYGDELVLKGVYGLSEKEIESIRNARDTLRKWRLPEGRKATAD